MPLLVASVVEYEPTRTTAMWTMSPAMLEPALASLLATITDMYVGTDAGGLVLPVAGSLQVPPQRYGALTPGT